MRSGMLFTAPPVPALRLVSSCTLRRSLHEYRQALAMLDEVGAGRAAEAGAASVATCCFRAHLKEAAQTVQAELNRRRYLYAIEAVRAAGDRRRAAPRPSHAFGAAEGA